MKEDTKITVKGYDAPCKYVRKMENGKHKVIIFTTMNPPDGIKYWYPMVGVETKDIKEVS